ncbi:MAG: FUN14 domain-containing protein [Planctomycetota bacterium]
MNDPAPRAAPGELGTADTQLSYQFSRWKLALMAAAGVFVVTGLVLRLVSGGPDAPPTRVPQSAGTLPIPPGSGPEQSFAPGSSTAPILPPPNPAPQVDLAPERDSWSPAFLRGGFGFFMGFCIGYATRMFVRMAAVVVGINLLLLAWFSYLGWVDVRWDAMQTQLDAWFAGLRDDFGSFQTFLAGSLPSAALGGLGLFTGLKRN